MHIINLEFQLQLSKEAQYLTSDNNSPLKEVILLLRCFYTFMKVLGAIGTLMKGTGLTNILKSVYGANTVTGKAVERAFRGHLLIDKCLNHLIVSATFNANPEFASLIAESERIYSSVILMTPNTTQIS